ncbi:YdeI/OmpD-associated family protein [Maribacter sp. HTCC2170]|uniref:YdeI/OmpD-associated family protein n=1 Tax=Maribacter sp. (strain HTCC2170 / KCCM 42371) TaxID=313603 RepID=UPI00006B4708|nr:YdeI/OmpD-associated family protein [Maribacter sp. HTCC2170]EAR01661.1 hypothetical protein FB2170_14073 [Maribacter sp. HTCC2170]
MNEIDHYYFENDKEWRAWLDKNHLTVRGVYLIFYKKGHEKESMNWEEAVRVALCYGWIDSTVKSLGDGKRQQYFCKRKPKGTWSKVNKLHIKDLTKLGLMHESGLKAINSAKSNGSWTLLDDVENGIVPKNLQNAFKQSPIAFKHFQNFTFGQRKSYLYWLKQAKREETQQKRIKEIIKLCEANIKQRT